MGTLLDAIKEAIEEEVRSGEWNGVKIESGEGALIDIDITESEFDLDDVDLGNDRYVVKAKGDGTIFSIEDEEERKEVADVLVTATVEVSIGPKKNGIREIEVVVESVNVDLDK
ncbi:MULTISPECIES: hypothetical protein [Xanthomonas]|uniref:hypothetical protein n=1 Tax=Xanthomonas TaxID=338 RepID=UPI000CEDE7AA|nr:MULTISPECIES: hypothetical protein [Xanthomonas]MBB5674717.1 hypothetical protein [Xanthomonas arboricola]PPU37714.1 hypothetical protein XspCFBP7912_01155 [Xanthomonas sp. CFBP 7912]